MDKQKYKKKYKKNKIRQTLRSKSRQDSIAPVSPISFGTWVQMASPEIVEVVGYQGYDFAIIDMEHGQFGFDTAYSMVRAADAADITPVVRVPDKTDYMIYKAFDMGAMVVIVPNVTTKEQAAQVVRAAKYYPKGMRGACPWVRATEYNVDEWKEYATWARKNTEIWITIESKEGVDNLDDILSVKGIDGVMVGSFDLSQTLGVPGETNHPLVLEYVQKIADKVAQKKNVDLVAAVFASPEEIRPAVMHWQQLGSNIQIIGGDRAMLSDAYKNLLKGAQGV